MSAAECCHGTCRRKQPIRVFVSDLTDRVYAVTNWRTTGGGLIDAREKHDVTLDVRHLMAAAWSDGWDAYRDSKPGDVVPNPHEPHDPP